MVEGGGLREGSLTERIIGCAIEVHRELGPGLLESMYEEALAMELEAAGIPFLRQVEIPVLYKGRELPGKYRLDLLVSSLVVVELKCVEMLLPVHEAQLLTYLKLGDWRTGLLLNFNTALLRDGIRRMVI